MPDLFGFSRYEHPSRSAEISDCGRYRYWLRRSWKTGGNGKTVCFVMLNPSTADAMKDDPTIRRCMGFTQTWGYSILSVRNLFALRATDPGQLSIDPAPIGPKNDMELSVAKTADLVVVAWGAKVPFGRDNAVLKLLSSKSLFCLAKNKNGSPKHPLYCAAGCVPIPF